LDEDEREQEIRRVRTTVIATAGAVIFGIVALLALLLTQGFSTLTPLGDFLRTGRLGF
jgi:hypothetical protein